jgi:DNA-binding transcriptional LysR family regulator
MGAFWPSTIVYLIIWVLSGLCSVTDIILCVRGAEFSEYAAFVAVADAGNFIGGARRKGISASAMSQIIRRLEARVGIQLFRRTTRSVSLTEEGERLLERLRRAFSEIESATHELDEHRSKPAGIVRVVVPRVAYRDLVEPLLPQFHASYPEVALDIHVNDEMTDIVSKGYDIGLRLGEYINPETVAFRVGPPLRQIAVASPAYISRHGAPRHPRELARHQCINWRQNPGDQPYAWEFAKKKARITVNVRGPLTLNDRELAAHAARGGLGIALWVEHRLRGWIQSGELVPVLEDWSPPYPGFHAYYYRDRHLSSATRAFLTMLRESRAVGEHVGTD